MAEGLGYVGAGWFVVLVAALFGELISFFFFCFSLVLTLWVFFGPADLWTFDVALALGLAALWNEGAQIEERTGLVGRSLVSPDPSSEALQKSSFGAFLGLIAGFALCWWNQARPAVPVVAAFLGAFFVDYLRDFDGRRSLATAMVILETGNGGRFLKLLIGGLVVAAFWAARPA